MGLAAQRFRRGGRNLFFTIVDERFVLRGKPGACELAITKHTGEISMTAKKAARPAALVSATGLAHQSCLM
jgi:hypothetical protein